MNKQTLVAALVLAVLPPVANAYSVSVITDTNVQTDSATGAPVQKGFLNSSNPETSVNQQTVGDPSTYAYSYAVATANGGSLGVVTYSRSYGVVDSTGGVSLKDKAINAYTEAEAKLTIDDFMISGPGSVANDVYLNLAVSGFVHASALSVGGSAYAETSSNVSLTAYKGPGVVLSGSQGLRAEHYNGTSDPAVQTPSETGDLVGVTFPATLAIGPFTLPTDSPLTFGFDIDIKAITYLFGVGEGDAIGNVNFGSTVSLPTSGPVFTLPTGFSASSVSADVSGNQWFGTPVSITAVPVPPAAGLLLASLMLLLACRRISVRVH